jgi:hypothetical protein
MRLTNAVIERDRVRAERRLLSDAAPLLARYGNTVIRHSDYELLGEKRCLELLPGATIRVSTRFGSPTVIVERKRVKDE